MFPAFQSYLLLIPCVRAHCFYIYGLPRWLGGKESACNAGDVGLIPGSGRSSGGGNATHSSIFIYICVKSLQSYLTLSTLWTVAPQAPLSMGFSRQEH